MRWLVLALIFAAAPAYAVDWNANQFETPSGSETMRFKQNPATGDIPLVANQCAFIDNGLVCEGATADSFESRLQLPEATGADSLVTFPGGGQVVTTDAAQTLTNKTLDDPLTINDATITFGTIDQAAITSSLIGTSTIDETNDISGASLHEPVLKGGSDPASFTTEEGKMWWETDADILHIGTGSALQAFAKANSTGVALTALALATNPADCTAGQFANAIAANGDLTCATPAGGGGGSSLLQVTDVTSGGTLLARTFGDGAGVIRRVDVFPETTIKTDEGAAGTAGTIAWAEAQLTAGGEVFLNAGTYNVGTTITFDVAGTMLRCADPQTAEMKAKSTLTGPILKLGWAGAARQGMYVLNCGFNGNPASATGATPLVALKDVADSRIEGNYIRYWRGKGLTVGCSIGAVGAPQCLQTIIARNSFFSSGSAATTAGSAIEVVADASKPATDSRIVFNDIGGFNTDGDNASAWVKIGNGTANGTNGWSIQGNHIYGWDRGACIEVADPTAQAMDIQNNTLESCTGAIKWTGDASGSAGWSLIQGNKMYGFSRQCSSVGAGSYVGKRCAADADCGTGGICNTTGPKVFDFNRLLRTTIANNEMRSQQGGVASFISLADGASAGGSNHNQVTGNMIDFTVAGEKGIVFANSSSNNMVLGNKCRGIGGGGGGTCIDGGTISTNSFFSNVCNNVCTALDVNMPTFANMVRGLDTAVGDVGDFTCTGGSATPCTIDAGAVTNAKLASSYSGVGACGANTFASTLTVNAAPTCTQPSFANLSGTATDAQIPDSITVNLAGTATALAANPADCTANQYATTIAANGDLTCAQPDHGALAGLADDDHTQYLALAGRAGSANNAVISTDSTGQIAGSLTSGQGLTLLSATTGTASTLYIESAGLRTPGSLTFDPDNSASINFINYTDGTETISGIWALNSVTGGTYTINNNAAGFIGFNIPSGVILDYTAATNPAFGSIANTFNASYTVRDSSGRTATWTAPYQASVTFDANNVAMTLTDAPDYQSLPIFKVTGTGTFGGTSARIGYLAKATVNGGTINQYRGFVVQDKTGAGNLNSQVGIDIAGLSSAGLNIGIRNADTMVEVPSTVVIANATTAVSSGASFVCVDVDGANQDLTVDPQITDGAQAGQRLTIMNCNPDGDGFTLKLDDGAGLQMDAGASCTLAVGDNISFIYSTVNGVSDWRQSGPCLHIGS